jgi:hypothetical protein
VELHHRILSIHPMGWKGRHHEHCRLLLLLLMLLLALPLTADPRSQHLCLCTAYRHKLMSGLSGVAVPSSQLRAQGSSERCALTASSPFTTFSLFSRLAESTVHVLMYEAA